MSSGYLDLDKCLDLARAWLKQNQTPIEFNLTYKLDGPKVDMPVGSEVQCISLPQKNGTNPFSENALPDPEKTMTQAFVNTVTPIILEIAVNELGYVRKNTSRVIVSYINKKDDPASSAYARGFYQFIPPQAK